MSALRQAREALARAGGLPGGVEPLPGRAAEQAPSREAIEAGSSAAFISRNAVSQTDCSRPSGRPIHPRPRPECEAGPAPRSLVRHGLGEAALEVAREPFRGGGGRMRRRSVEMPWDMWKRVEALAGVEQVGVDELVRVLLARAMRANLRSGSRRKGR